MAHSGNEIPPLDPHDAAVLDALRDAGADLRKPRNMRHYLYFATEESAREVGEVLTARRGTAEVRPAATGSSWLVLYELEVITDAQSVAGLRMLLGRIAAAADGEYDGWEAAPTP